MASLVFLQMARNAVRSALPRARPALITVGTGVVSTDSDGIIHTAASSYEPKFLSSDDTPTRIPESVSMLINAKVTVPSVRLRDDLDWATLTQSPLLDENPELREEVMRIHERLNTWARLEQVVSPGYAIEILHKFGYWLDLHEIHHVIHAGPEVRQAIDASMKDVEGGMTKLQEMYDSSLKHMHNGDHQKAAEIGNRALRKAERMNSMLIELHNDLEKAQHEDWDLFKKLLITAAATGATLALIEYMQKDGAISAALLALQNVLGTTCVASGGYALFVLVTSTGVAEYLGRVKSARKARNKMYHKLEDLVDEAIMKAT